MKKIVALLVLSFIVVYNGHIVAQTLSDSSRSAAGIAVVRTQYTKFIGPSSYLYNGTAYVRYWNGVRGDPFFLTEAFQNGNINYGGVLYTDVPLVYDITRDELITKNFTKETDIKLVSEKVNEFFIGKHDFVRLSADHLNNTAINPGFYERLYNGTTAVYVRHEKKIERSARAEDNFSKFTQYDIYYLVKDSVFHVIEGESGLSSVLKDQRQEVRKFLGKKDINYKKDPEGTIVQVAAFYDRLKN